MSNTFGQRLKYLRNTSSMTQSQMAELLDISTRQYQLYEAGQSYPSFHGLITLSDHFFVSLDYLTGRLATPRHEEFIENAEKELLAQITSKPFTLSLFYQLPDVYKNLELRKQTYPTEKRVKILFYLREQIRECYEDYKRHLEALKEFEPTLTNEIKKRINYSLQKAGLMEPTIYAATSPEDREKSRKKYQKFHELLYGDLQEEESSDKSSLFKEKRYTKKTPIDSVDVEN